MSQGQRAVKRQAGATYAEIAQALQLRPLDILLNGVWSEAASGNPQKLDRALAIMDRQNALLGLLKNGVSFNTMNVTEMPIQVVEIHYDNQESPLMLEMRGE